MFNIHRIIDALLWAVPPAFAVAVVLELSGRLKAHLKRRHDKDAGTPAAIH
jgi:hypothetical protein